MLLNYVLTFSTKPASR